MRTNNIPCPRCGKDKAGVMQPFKGQWKNYTYIDCRGCGLWKATLNGDYNQALSGGWSRNQKAELQAHSKDVLQPLKKDGTVNKNFVSAFGTKGLEKEMKVSKREILNNVEKYG